MSRTPYDPLDYENLAASVVAALMNREPEALPPDKRFAGAGVYAIYYHGDFAPYRPVTSLAEKIPIYVGKAVEAGARKGSAKAGTGSTTTLYTRLGQHSKSIAEAENLVIEDFSCRCLVVVPVWISLAERFLISHFKPLWNTTVDGFGNHNPGRGAGTRPQSCSWRYRAVLRRTMGTRWPGVFLSGLGSPAVS